MFNIEIAFVKKYYTWDHTLDPKKKLYSKKAEKKTKA